MKDDPLNRLKTKRGEELPHAKLTNQDVKNIRALINYREGIKAEASELSNKKIAEKFEVHVRTIDRISSGENWAHVVD